MTVELKDSKGSNLAVVIEDSTKGLKVSEIVKITINDSMVKVYNQMYFARYPRRRKAPIDKCIPPSLNVWGNMDRIQKNDLKQKWNDFGIWVVDQYGLTNKKIERCKITWNYYFPTKHKRDADNTVPKFLSDSLVCSGLLVEDNYTVVNPVILQIFYDKENPRMEIIIEVLE